jgi:UDP-glucose 4-epimerase
MMDLNIDFPFGKALFTGGAGFIGIYVVEELVKIGVETISIDNYFAEKRENLSHLKGYKIFFEVTFDIFDVNELGKLIYFGGKI